ncbi:unnamed protein product [Blepharisma stoltei]|uniref:Uncharacterized protein n=1 Tax=Blepharisma stoltei TaxID=1481888 RepID=A0AAU9KJI0_9CILI|nr:unnamed protein product [Blepharisma stoltei]
MTWLSLILFLLFWLTFPKLIFVAEITRHGARAPLKVFNFHTPFWRNYDRGQLTHKGKKQHFLLGNKIRKKYVEDLQLLNFYYNSSEIYACSSNKERTRTSAYYHMLGIYPNFSRKIMQDQNSEFSYFFPNLAACNHEMLKINVLLEQEDHILRGYDEIICPRVEQIYQSILKSDSYKSKENELKPLFDEVSSAVNLTINSIKSASQLGSSLSCDLFEGNILPYNLTMEHHKSLTKVQGFKKFFVPYSNEEAQILVCSQFFKDLIIRINEAFDSRGYKYAYYSAHDTTLAGFLSCLNLVQEECPPFASSLIFEVYSEREAKIIYNDKLLKLPDCSKESCPVAEFIQILEKKTINDIELACQIKQIG